MNIIKDAEPTEEELDDAYESYADWEREDLIAHITRVTKAAAIFTGYSIGVVEAVTGSTDVGSLTNAAEQMKLIFIGRGI